MSQIRGKVAKVLTDRRLIINRGTNDGVEIGMRFAILADEDNQIRDPDSNAILGSIDVFKTIVKIVQVETQFSIGKTFRTLKEGGAFGINEDINRLFKPSTTKIETFVESGRISEKTLDSKSSYVEPGDLAYQTTVEVSELVIPIEKANREIDWPTLMGLTSDFEEQDR